jgi:arylformamidase
VNDSLSRPDTERELIDISIPYDAATAVWPGDVPFSCGWTARREDGSSVNLSVITTSTHAGTHADAPLHVDSGWAASGSLPPSAFVGTCVVIALPEATPGADVRASLASPVLSAAMLRDLLGNSAATRVLVRTNSSVSAGAFPEAWPVLDEDAAEWLVSRGVQLVGTDAPSVDARDSKTLPVHRRLFAAGAYVLENLDLRGVVSGEYELLAQPLAIVGADAAPVRALLRRL